jgi:tyrosine-protein kinase Etk/Wzc
MIVSFEDSLKVYPSTMVLNSIAGKRNASADGIKRRLIDLRVEERDLTRRYQKKARPLVDIREQISLLEKELAKEEATVTEITTGIDTNYQALMLEMNKEQSIFRGLIAQSKILTEELKKRKTELLQLSNLEHKYHRLQKEVDIAKEGYYQYRENLQRTEIYTALDANKISNVRVVQPAFVSTKPVRPNRILFIFLGLFLGFFGSISLAFILNYMDDSLKSDLDVKNKLGLPVFAMISYKDYQKCF